MLRLPQGESFLHDKRRGYWVFSFDLKVEGPTARNVHSFYNTPVDSPVSLRITPAKQEVFSRLWPGRVAMLGMPGYALLIARQLAIGGDVQMWMGYVGWHGYPIIWHNPILMKKGQPGTWVVGQEIWYTQQHVDFTNRMIDRKTRVIVRMHEQQDAARAAVLQARDKAKQDSRNALKAHRQRVSYQRKKRLEQQEREEQERQQAILRSWHQPEILANLQEIHGKIIAKKQQHDALEAAKKKMQEIEDLEQWL